jgi:hypothetical protein
MGVVAYWLLRPVPRAPCIVVANCTTPPVHPRCGWERGSRYPPLPRRCRGWRHIGVGACVGATWDHVIAIAVAVAQRSR